jgi:hypothetical protein
MRSRKRSVTLPVTVPRLWRGSTGCYKTIKVVSEAADEELPIELDSKDRPVLLAAIAASVDYLLTGDRTHFGHLYDSKVRGVRILLPADYLNRRGPGRR